MLPVSSFPEQDLSDLSITMVPEGHVPTIPSLGDTKSGVMYTIVSRFAFVGGGFSVAAGIFGIVEGVGDLDGTTRFKFTAML
mmetsp:Transcript_34029/g.78451  ORF Transcript_34029/g.78451 Transcript_34029/m.78451 type:complete len:82 (-) Transcript_34029:289-534(-)